MSILSFLFTLLNSCALATLFVRWNSIHSVKDFFQAFYEEYDNPHFWIAAVVVLVVLYFL